MSRYADERARRIMQSYPILNDQLPGTLITLESTISVEIDEGMKRVLEVVLERVGDEHHYHIKTAIKQVLDRER